jgi:hypothetical protein
MPDSAESTWEPMDGGWILTYPICPCGSEQCPCYRAGRTHVKSELFRMARTLDDAVSAVMESLSAVKDWAPPDDRGRDNGLPWIP